jgi:hypothetical protein
MYSSIRVTCGVIIVACVLCIFKVRWCKCIKRGHALRTGLSVDRLNRSCGCFAKIKFLSDLYRQWEE